MPYDGSGQPVPLFTPVDVRLRNGVVLNNVLARDLNWQHIFELPLKDIVEWRLHPSALPPAKSAAQAQDERQRGLGLLRAIVDSAEDAGNGTGISYVATSLIAAASDFLKEVQP